LNRNARKRVALAGFGATLLTEVTVDSENGRLQTAWGKHDNRVNVLFVDGHSVISLASQLTWGQFWGVYGNPPAWPALPHAWDTSISKPAYDSQVWSNLPE